MTPGRTRNDPAGGFGATDAPKWTELVGKARVFLVGQGRRGSLLLICAVLVALLSTETSGSRTCTSPTAT